MSVATYIANIEASRNTIRNKLVQLGMAQSGDKLDKLAIAIEGIINQGAVSVTVKEGDTYTIPKGYHNGSGTVSGVGGGGNYNLQSKTATPTKSQQNVTPDSGYFGLSDVTIAAIPEAYQDVTSVTATAADVLTGKIFVTADGTVTPGEMINNGAVSKTLDATSITYTIPKGYHSGSGKVQIVLETKSVTPTKDVQEITPTSGKVLEKVTVNPIPDNYIDTSDADATATDLARGKIAYVNGEKVIGDLAEASEGDKVFGSGEVTLHTSPGDTTIAMTAAFRPDKIGDKTISCIIRPGAEIGPRSIPSSLFGNAAPEQIAKGATFTSAAGLLMEGTMPDNGAVSAAIDGMTTVSYTIPKGYHDGTGTVSLTSDIETALAAI